MNIKLIATDVDGTLVADDHLTIPPINIKSLKMAKENNINIVISTGRPYSLTEIEAAKLGSVDYLVLSNGAVVVDAKTKGVIYDCYLPLEQLEKNIPDLVFSAGFKGNMEIAAKGADKGRGLAWLADKLGINSEEVMAFGDSGNDVTMLEFAGHSYAMISGNEKAKSAAKYVTKLSNNNGGVGDTVREIFGLNI